MSSRASGKLGIRQKLALAKLRQSQSELGKHLRGLFSSGRLRAGEVATTASAAASHSSSSALADLRRMAKAKPTKKRVRCVGGKARPDTRNAARGIRRSVGQWSLLGTPYIAEVLMWDRKQNVKTTGKMSFLPIHEVLEAIIPEKEEGEWCSFDATQQGFRMNMHDWAGRVGVPLSQLAMFLAIALWGDSAVFTHRDSLFILLFTVLSGQNRRRYWICAFNKRRLCKCGCFGRCTFDGIFGMLAWMFRALLSRRWPAVDHLGQPFPAGSFRAKMAGKELRVGGACIAKCGDWSWHKSVLGMRGWRGDRGTKRMCWLCQAAFNDDHDCYDFSGTASWRRELTTQSEFWDSAMASNQYISAIWQIPGFQLSFVRPDWMHVTCLGILQYLAGNVLWELFKALGGTFRNSLDACSKLENMIAICSKHLGLSPPFTNLTVTMFRVSASDKPKFKAKAAENRHFLPVLRDMLTRCFTIEAAHRRLRFQCVDALHKCYVELDSWCPEQSPHRLAKHARQHLLLCVELRTESTDPLLWNLYPKHHLFAHVAEGAITNPRLEWNYADESEIGAAVKQAQVTNVQHLPVHLIQRYRDNFECEPI